MNNLARLGAALILAFSLDPAHARPVIIEESAVLTAPPGSNYVSFGYDVGTNGEFALVGAAHPQPPGAWLQQDFDALLYRRVNGNWVYQRVLAQGSRTEGDDTYYPVLSGLKGNLASVQLGDARGRIFRFNGTDWVFEDQGAGLHEDLSIDGDRVLYGVGQSWNGEVFQREADGTWRGTSLPGQPRCCDDEFWGGPVDLSGDHAILGTPYTYDLEPQEIPIYRTTNGGQTWALQVKLQVPSDLYPYQLDEEVGFHVNNALVNSPYSGPYVWTNGNFYGEPTARLQVVNTYARGSRVSQFAKDGNLLLATTFDPDFNRNVINVFRWDATNSRYDRVAILKPSAGTTSIGNIEIDGNTVIAGSIGKAMVFELPASFASAQPRFENFESGNGANWTPSAGSQFAVVRPSAANQVYRQASLTGDAKAVLGNSSGVHQAVEADVKPFAFGCADCWAGLATRYVDPQNYYYVTLRYSGSLQLKRMRGGTFTTLASTPLPVTLSRTYRVRLDSIGNTHRVFVDGKLLLSYEDNVPLVAGNAALIMYKAKVDYDNVAVSPVPRTSIFADDFASPATYRGDWTHNGPGQWTTGNGVFQQNSVAAEARALIGAADTDDQIVSFRVRPVAYATSSNGQERWVGAIARYRNEQNYYYLTLRTGGTLSLRKLVNGAIMPIAEVPASMTLGAWHSLRLEATGSSLRAYVNNALVMQATDTSHTAGRTGAMTYKTAAEFDDFAAYQP